MKLDNAIPSKLDSYAKFIDGPLKYSGVTVTISRRLKMIYIVLKR